MSYFGVDYYPEHWPSSQMEEDLTGIKGLGANMIRIGEFAWHVMEPKEGEFDFSYFDKVIEQAKAYEFKVMFGTPTATFPAWLAHKYPSILSKDEYGTVREFGGRRQYCFNSEEYREYSARITRELIKHYRNEEAIVVWQVDNEFGHEGSDQCYCEQCKRAFQKFLKEKYNDIHELNERWGTIFWGQTYNDFTEIPAPTPTITTHNPSLKLDWARFRSFSLNSYAHQMTEIVREEKGPHQEITTNVSGGFFDKWFDHEENLRPMDFVSYDNYPVWGGLEQPIPPSEIAMTLDFNRGLKGQNFWIVEELMGAQGHDVIGYLPRPNQAKLWSYQAFAHGCSNMLYFRWRGMTRGAEQFCYGVIDHDNRYGRKYHEVKDVFTEMSKYDQLLESPIEAEIAVLYDYDNIWSWRAQTQSKDFHFNQELMRLYQPFYDLNTKLDVIPADRDFSNYKVVLVPVMQVLNEELATRLKEFTKQGGTVIFSFRAGLKDKDNVINFGQTLPGPVADLTGIRVEEIESLTAEHRLSVKGEHDLSQEESYVNIWRDLIVPEGAETIYRYTDSLYKEYAAVTRNSYGDGEAFYIGGGLDVEGLRPLVKKVVENHNIDYEESPIGVEVYTRVVDEKEYQFIMNHTEEEVSYMNKVLAPYETQIVKK
ncbi:beta-galactosidase [Pontibacillus salipaludis]|uniref:Beta-galactosidase n=1 Tax=Pontibacillus salipaludis TaxID=1697394 RepID=A0ABQ1Q6N1_9BACI|nr:beta-galactosidase [Pontibacillus salipaludis]GGD14626.1 beta-galactosidase [Pontibacillus salipaludis]